MQTNRLDKQFWFLSVPPPSTLAPAGDFSEDIQGSVDIVLRVTNLVTELPYQWLITLARENQLASIAASKKSLLPPDASELLHALEMKDKIQKVSGSEWKLPEVLQDGLACMTSAYSLFLGRKKLEPVNIAENKNFDEIFGNLFLGFVHTLDMIAQSISAERKKIMTVWTAYSPVLNQLESWDFKPVEWMFAESAENDKAVQQLHHCGWPASHHRLIHFQVCRCL